MRLAFISFAVGASFGAAARAAMAHYDPTLFFNPFFPFFPSYF